MADMATQQVSDQIRKNSKVQNCPFSQKNININLLRHNQSCIFCALFYLPIQAWFQMVSHGMRRKYHTLNTK